MTLSPKLSSGVEVTHSLTLLALTCRLLGDELDGLGLCPEVLARAVDPDVHALRDVVGLLQGQVPVQDSLVGRGVEVHRGVRVRRLKKMPTVRAQTPSQASQPGDMIV